MIEPDFRNRLEIFSNGQQIRAACTAKTGASAWWTAMLLTAAVASAVWLDARAGAIGTAVITTLLVVAATTTWINRETYAFALTDNELFVLSTPRLARYQPDAIVHRIPISEASLTVASSAYGFASVYIDGQQFDVPSSDFVNAHGLGQLAITYGATPLSHT